MSRRTFIPLVVIGIAALSILPFQRAHAADDFRLTIGNPIAAMMPATGSSAPVQKKVMGNFVVRVDGCPEPTKADIKATAEGLVNGVRKSIPLTLATTIAPGVQSVLRSWGDGVWVVNLVATYENLKAGAVVPVVGDTFVRDSSKFYSRPATAAEVDEVLKAHAINVRTR